jgi:hypothetical protein
VRCDVCNVWHHKSCIELCTHDYELLQRSNVQWYCCKCESLNVDTFTFNNYEINNSNYYDPIKDFEGTLASITSTTASKPLQTSSPKQTNEHKSTSVNNSSHGTNHSSYAQSSEVYNLPAKQNLRILNINCRSIRDKKPELEAVVNYTKPDIICGTELWLKGVKPGQNPTKDAIKSSEIFPSDCLHYRSDRGTLGGGIFILVHKSIISIEQPEIVTDCEIEWVKIKFQK